MITTKEYSVKNRNRTINGVLYIPAHNVKGSVIFSHGYNGSYKHSETECTLLAEAGYYTYAFDFPGGSNSSISTGLSTTEMKLFPEKEDLRSLASHGATMVLFLSTGLLKKVTEELIAGGYSPDTPAAIVYKASWDDQKVCRCTVADLEETARKNGITKTALITVGAFLDSDFARSKLYDPGFATEFREASN